MTIRKMHNEQNHPWGSDYNKVTVLGSCLSSTFSLHSEYGGNEVISTPGM